MSLARTFNYGFLAQAFSFGVSSPWHLIVAGAQPGDDFIRHQETDLLTEADIVPFEDLNRRLRSLGWKPLEPEAEWHHRVDEFGDHGYSMPVAAMHL